jgi:hypothetical protein
MDKFSVSVWWIGFLIGLVPWCAYWYQRGKKAARRGVGDE